MNSEPLANGPNLDAKNESTERRVFFWGISLSVPLLVSIILPPRRTSPHAQKSI